MKRVLIIIGLLASFSTFGQSNNNQIKAIAQLVSYGEGGKVHIAEYQVIKVLEGDLKKGKIKVGYHFYSGHQNSLDTVLLNLIPYSGETEIADYYIFPDYDAKNGIEKIKLSYVGFDYWESCETGDCEPLLLTRKSAGENWCLFMPCGGTQTDITLTELGQKEPVEHISLDFPNCPPVFDLTNLSDGKYFAYMLACGLGGQIEINLKTENKK